MKPFLKWMGGKQKVIQYLEPFLPKEYNTYYEPFVGGGAMLFYLAPDKAVINDKNKYLMNCYRFIRENPNEFIDNVQLNFNSIKNELDSNDRRKVYYDIRSKFNNKIIKNEYDLDMAVYFYVVLRTCFNGVFQVNKQNIFNNSMGRIDSQILDEQNLLEISRYLKNVNIMSEDYKICCETAKENDFIFFDSPYDDSFTRYTTEQFDKKKQTELRDLVVDLTKKGVKCMLTNNNTEFINNLFADDMFYKNYIITQRSVNTKAPTQAKEIVITNYKENNNE